MKKITTILGGLAILTLALVLPPLRTLNLRAQGPGYVGWSFVHTVKVASDFTDSNASGAQNIPNLLMTFPAGIALTYQIDCDLFYSQATVVADNFGVQFQGNSPTNSEFGGFMFTNATAIAAGTPANITNTTAANVTTGTPAVTTVLYAHLGGTAEIPSNATDTTLQVNVTQSTAADVIVVKRGSVCRWVGMP